MPNSRHSDAIVSPSLSRITNRIRSSTTERSFHGILLSAPFGPKSVTYVSGTFCYPCLGTDKWVNWIRALLALRPAGTLTRLPSDLLYSSHRSPHLTSAVKPVAGVSPAKNCFAARTHSSIFSGESPDVVARKAALASYRVG